MATAPDLEVLVKYTSNKSKEYKRTLAIGEEPAGPVKHEILKSLVDMIPQLIEHGDVSFLKLRFVDHFLEFEPSQENIATLKKSVIDMIKDHKDVNCHRLEINGWVNPELLETVVCVACIVFKRIDKLHISVDIEALCDSQRVYTGSLWQG